MSPIRFIDNRFQEITVAQANAPFSVWSDGEMSALKVWLLLARAVVAVVFFPKVLAHYVAVLVRVAKVPAPAVDLLKAEYSAQEAEKLARTNKKAKKLGFKPKEGGISAPLN